MGLTFYTPAEARSFNRGVRVALEQLARVAQAEYTSSSASSTCGRLSDDHQSSCTSPASSTGSSSCCGAGANYPKRKSRQEGSKKLSTSSASSSSSRQLNSKSRSSPTTKQSRSHRIAHNSTSSSTSAQVNRSTAGPAVTAAPTLSLLSSTTSPRFCETPSSCDLQTHFRWPLPQQQPYSTNVSFLNRPIAKEGSPYELSALVASPPLSASSTLCRDADSANPSKNQVPPPCSGDDLDLEKQPEICTASPTRSHSHLRHSVRSRYRDDNHTSQDGRPASQRHSMRTRSYRSTKTPHLDILERQRDLKPTEPNSYVLFSSSKPATVMGSQRVAGRGLATGDYKTLGQLSIVDGYQYHPLLPTICTDRPYQHPQTGTLSIMASTADASRFYNRSDLFHSTNIDTIKDDAIFYEARSSLISSPKKPVKMKDSLYYGESLSDSDGRRDSGCGLSRCLCCKPPKWGRRRSSARNHKEDLAERSKCRHCHEMFNHERNRPGSCRDAPDKCLDSIRKVTCLFCADSLFYHCCRDDEGDYHDEPCTCSSAGDGSRSRFWKRWATLTTLSIILPCLCLYPPLRACHGCGVACHCCGGKHQAPFPSTKSDKGKR